jgi:hypothetical protein
MLETCEYMNIPDDVGLYTRKTENLATPLPNAKNTLFILLNSTFGSKPLVILIY